MLDTAFIEARRTELGLTQEQAAKAAGLSSRHYWSRLENGRARAVRAETLLGMAAALRCKVDRLLVKPATKPA